MSFTVAKILAQALELEKLAVCERISLGEFHVHNGDEEWQTRTLPILWGGQEQVWHFAKELVLPASWTDQCVQLYFDLGAPRDRTACEGLLYLNGKRFFGIDTRHKYCDVPAEILESGRVKIDLDVFAGLGRNEYRFERADLRRVHPEVLDLSRWLKTLAESVDTLPDDDTAKYRLLNLLGIVYERVDLFSPKSDVFLASVQAALHLLHETLAQLPPDPYVPKVTALGHSHIDLAYLWRVEHTRRKSVHTFSTVLTLMKKYPELTYLQSQPQLYEYLEADAPDLFAEIEQRVQEGRWEAEGGMWVEADCNIPAGESLVRQFLYGIDYFKTKFNRASKILWLPDVFGYSSALPQILQLCNIPYFMTTKISWNDKNRLPYDTFRWKGLDGSEVLTHFITTPEHTDTRYTYNGILDAPHSAGLWRNYQQKDINSELLLAFGYGDGGGGPTEDMIEAGKRIHQIPRMPDIQFGTAREYFEQLEQRVAKSPALPVWDGELYLEYHRGTYTSQAKNKQFNRSSELLYREAELWNTFSEAGAGPDQAALHEGWKLILKNQFHDIIPGTGIASVFQDSDKDYGQIIETGNTVLRHALDRLTADVHRQQTSLAVFNSLPWTRTDFIQLEGQQYLIDSIPACGYKLIALDELNNRTRHTPTTSWKIAVDEMENDYFHIQFSATGQLRSVWDKRASREVLAPGEHGNVLEVFEDRPLKYDNWNIDEDFSLKSAEITELQDVQVLQNDGTTGAVQFKWRWRDSVIVQKVIIYRHRAVVDFDTQVDWQERQTLLKVAFPVDVRASFATYDIQFGNVARPTHANTSWDEARFEMCAHKWIDLSDSGYGVSLINDSKYGHDIKGHRIRTTLLKSGIYPDPQADRGQHSFRYRLFPHLGSWLEAGTQQAAFEFNVPLQVQVLPGDPTLPNGRQYSTDNQLQPMKEEFSFLEMNSEHVMLDTVKLAEDGQGMILRFYEYGGRRGNVSVRLTNGYRQITEVNLLEEPLSTDTLIDTQSSTGSFSFVVQPYQIVTFRIQ